MLRFPLPRFLLPRSARPVPSWPGVLLACALSVLLLAAVHCSSYLVNDGHQHLSLSGPAAPAAPAGPTAYEETPRGPGLPDRPRHEHGSSCVSPCLSTWASAAAQRPAEATAAPEPPLPGAAHATAETAAAAASSGRPSIARTGRSRLADVGRWQI
ncbi:hypothetical protein ACFRJ1_16345 [Streptomyces sp. NPDC056773]|uniref:hypothetical protein n=1 Tax=unclassified Streptomyces TaxID=2593676 RepID=UPI003696D1B9